LGLLLLRRLWPLFDAYVIEFAGMGIERYIDISETFFLSNMSKDHARQLVPTFEMFYPVIAFVFVNNTLKLISREEM